MDLAGNLPRIIPPFRPFAGVVYPRPLGALGLRGAALVSGVLGSPTALRIDPAKIETVLQRLVDAKRLDIDGNNATEAQTDGLLLLRAMLGFTGTSVTNNALGTGTPTRGDWPAIRTYLTDSCKLVLP